MTNYKEFEEKLRELETKKNELMRQLESEYAKMAVEIANKNMPLYIELTKQVPWSLRRYCTRMGSLEDFILELTARCKASVEYWENIPADEYVKKYGEAFGKLSPLEKSAMIKADDTDEIWEMLAEEAGQVYQLYLRERM